MESRSSDPENVAEKIIYNMTPKHLIEVAFKLYHQQMLDEDGKLHLLFSYINYNYI